MGLLFHKGNQHKCQLYLLNLDIKPLNVEQCSGGAVNGSNDGGDVKRLRNRSQGVLDMLQVI